MFARILIFFVILLAVFPPPAARAADCQQAAANAAASYGGQVIAVRTVTQNGATICEIKIRVPGTGGQPPRVETVRVGG